MRFGAQDHDMVFWIGDLNYRVNITNLDYIFRLIEHRSVFEE